MSEYENLFDFDTLTEDQKKAVLEAIKIIEERKDIPLHIIVNELKTTFKLEEIPMVDVKLSPWYQLTKDEILGATIQGYKIVVDESGNKVKIPNIAFNADLDYLDGMIQRMAAKFIKPQQP